MLARDTVKTQCLGEGNGRLPLLIAVVLIIMVMHFLANIVQLQTSIYRSRNRLEKGTPPKLHSQLLNVSGDK